MKAFYVIWSCQSVGGQSGGYWTSPDRPGPASDSARSAEIVPTIGPPKRCQLAFPPPCSPHCQPNHASNVNMLLTVRLCGKCKVGARCARHWPVWHRFAPFWQDNGTFPNLLQPAALQD